MPKSFLPFAPYRLGFHRLAAERAAASARLVVPRLARWLGPASVVDVGCGAGAWLAEWKRNGARDVLGLDQSLVPSEELWIEPRELMVADLARPFRCGRSFELAQSLEVAEHLPPESAEGFVEALTELAPIVLFSAAQPGQMGDHHVNERPPEYWRELFRARGYALFDPLRPLLRGDRRVRRWYRYNALLFARPPESERLPADVLRHHVPEQQAVADFRPALLRLAMDASNLLPASSVQVLANGERLLRRALTDLRNAGARGGGRTEAAGRGRALGDGAPPLVEPRQTFTGPAQQLTRSRGRRVQ